MAPSFPEAVSASSDSMLSKRYYYYCDRDDEGCSRWYTWGRWIFAAVVVLFFVIVFVLWGCYSNRRRRRRGVTPMYGTGWLAAPPKYPGPPGHGPGQFHPQGGPGYPQGPPPPAYGAAGAAAPQQPANTGTSFATSQGYYGHHEGIQMQPPQNSYQPVPSGAAAAGDYAPPAGPPPTK